MLFSYRPLWGWLYYDSCEAISPLRTVVGLLLPTPLGLALLRRISLYRLPNFLSPSYRPLWGWLYYDAGPAVGENTITSLVLTLTDPFGVGSITTVLYIELESLSDSFSYRPLWGWLYYDQGLQP